MAEDIGIRDGYIESKSYMLGFLEGKSSFAINIGLRENKTHKYIVLQPVISINSIDKDQIEYLQFVTNTKSNNISDVKKIKNSSKTHNLNIQNYEDIESIIELVEVRGRFLSIRKAKSFKKFKKAFELIKEQGYFHSKWKQPIEKIIDLKFQINERKSLNKKRMTKENWIKKIQKHLEI